MSKSADYRDDEAAILVALFRYGIIAELVERETFAHGEVSALVSQIADRPYYWPGKGNTTITERTVYAWRKTCLDGGIEALRPKLRHDAGQCRAISEDLLQMAIDLRKQQPKRWTSTLIDMIKLSNKFAGKLSFHRSTLDRHLARVGASRRQLKTLTGRTTTKLEFDNFGDLWVGDFKHGLPVIAPDGSLKTAKLSAFLDHKTRYPISDQWYLSEEIGAVRDTLMRAFLTWGPAKKIYVDRGAAYRAEQLAYSLGTIHCTLVHSKAYYSQGRGLIERWWQLTDAFLAELALRPEPYTLHELNRVWEAFRQRRYNDQIHSEIGMTPAEAVADVLKRPLDVAAARELFLVKKRAKVHKNTSCVELYGKHYRCDSFLRGQWVIVRYDINDLSSVAIHYQGKRIARAFPRKTNDPDPHQVPVDPKAPGPLTPDIDYLELVRADFDRKLLEHARPLAYSDLVATPDFDKTAFVNAVLDLAGIREHPAVVRELSAFWDAYGPLPEDLVRIGLEHAVRLHTRGRHVNVYLHAVRTLVLAHLKSS